jgi:hypothetical protein
VRKLFIPTLVLLVAALVPADADARNRHLRADLKSFEEVPALSTAGHGVFRATLSNDGEELDFILSYDDLEGDVLQAHLHLGQRGVNGGISIFLCTNLGNGPAGTQECPPSPATVEGTVTAADVIGPNGQGIAPEEWEEVKRAIAAGVVYANVHSTLFPGGEIRGQVRLDRRRDD